MPNYVYDIECIPNCFTAIFLETQQSKLINSYVDADIYGRSSEKSVIIQSLKKKIFVLFKQGDTEINDLAKLYEFLIEYKHGKSKVLISFNGIGYDDIMIDYIYTYYKDLKKLSLEEVLTKLKEVNDYIIDSFEMFFDIRKSLEIKTNTTYKSIDLQRLNNLHKTGNRVSLKQCSIYLKWYRIEDYEMPPYTYQQAVDLYGEDVNLDEVNKLSAFSRKIHIDELGNLIEYNYNDVFITNKLYEESLEELSSRVAAQTKYGISLLSSPRSGMAEKVIRLLYSQYTGLIFEDFIKQRTWRKVIKFSEIIHTNVKFNSPELQEFLSRLRDISIKVYEPDSKFSETVIFKGTAYSLGLGGIHSKDQGKFFKAENDYIIIDADVDSYYPRSIVLHKIRPPHLSVIILKIIEGLLVERLYYKRIKDKANAYIFKIIINAIFGKMGDADSIMKDDKAMYEVTINNQLYLLMLIEMLEEKGLNVISTNTDGVTCRIKLDKLSDYNTVLNEWCGKLGFTLEVNRYDIYVRTSVNDYLAKVNNNGKIEIKRKGDFDQFKYKELSSGYFHPIVPRAIEEYYLNDVPIQNTILEGTDILDYCMSVKTGKNYVNELHSFNTETNQSEVKTLTKNLRYFVSNSGGILLKRDVSTGKHTNVLKGKTVKILNRITPVESIKDYDINYNFYIGKCHDMINKINNVTTKLMKKNSGTLFDNLDEENEYI